MKKAYLYSLWSGRFTVYEGEVGLSPYGNCYFQGMGKSMQCGLEPGIVYNATLWLPEKDDEKAKSILINYEVEAIAKLEEKIKNHQFKIYTLKNF